ncbi:MAG: TolC family protein [Isosphaeraceae bacterium]
MLAVQTPAQNRLLRINIAKIAEQLNNLLGLPAGSVLVPVDPVPPEAPVHSAQEAADLAVAHNPRVLEAMANVQKARAGLTVAMTDYLPDISIFGSDFNQTAANDIQPNFGAMGVASATLKGTICAE